MTGVSLASIAEHADALLRIDELPDYPNALNGIQLANGRPIARIAAAVDVSRAVIDKAIDIGAGLLIVHHGMFWSGNQPIRGPLYERLKRLIEHDVAVYAAHLPLDAHPELGNNVLLARALGLTPTHGFASFRGLMVGARGTGPVETSILIQRARDFARQYGGDVRTTPIAVGRITRHWAICTGAGASAETLAEASTTGVDTLIVGEGPHHTAVEASELGIAVLYVGHYATETFGVRALGEEIERAFAIPWSFVAAPTGL